MSEPIRALIVVMVIGVPAFFLSRLIVASVVSRREFSVWRNAWLVVTVAAFLSGSFFIYAIVLILVCIYAHTVRGATVALFIILLFAAPSAEIAIGLFSVINNLIELSSPRILSIFLLIPILIASIGLRAKHIRSS